MPAIIAIFTFAGLALIAGLLISDSIANARHARWLRENNARRHGVGA